MNLDLIQQLRTPGKNETYLNIKITPSAPRDEIAGFMSDGTLKIRIHAAPEHGKANARLIAFLSEELDIHTEDIEIISGHTSHKKHLFIRWKN